MATANCVHPHAQHEHAWAHCEQLHGHHKAHWRVQCAVLSTPRTVCRCTCVHTSHLWLKVSPCVSSISSMHAHLCLVSCVFSLHPSLYFFIQSFFHLFLMSDEISMENPLCDSSFGSMVTLDYVNPHTLCSWWNANCLSNSFPWTSLIPMLQTWTFSFFFFSSQNVFRRSSEHAAHRL